MVTPFQCYKCFIALKLHFNDAKYDFFAMKGRTPRITYNSYMKRNDRHFFERIAKHRDPMMYILANFVNDFNGFASNFSDAPYNRWRRVTDSLEYTFRETLDKIPDINEYIRVVDGKSELLNMYFSGKIEPEILCILDKIYGIFKYWLKNLSNVVFSDIFKWLTNYSPFIDFDVKTYKKILINKYDPLRS